MIQQERLE